MAFWSQYIILSNKNQMSNKKSCALEERHNSLYRSFTHRWLPGWPCVSVPRLECIVGLWSHCHDLLGGMRRFTKRAYANKEMQVVFPSRRRARCRYGFQALTESDSAPEERRVHSRLLGQERSCSYIDQDKECVCVCFGLNGDVHIFSSMSPDLVQREAVDAAGGIITLL